MPDGASWSQYGPIGLFCGSMLLAQLWFMRHLVTVTLPAMISGFAAELKEERTNRLQQHLDNRADHQTLLAASAQGFDRLLSRVEDDHHAILERIEKAEGIFATSLQATRHRIINTEMGLNGVAETLRQVKEALRELREHQPGARRQRPPEKESGG